jgi:hypothetical protein
MIAPPIPCPSWCDGTCREYHGDTSTCCREHTQEDVRVVGVNDAGDENAVELALERLDTEATAGPVRVHLDLEEQSLHLTLAGARELAAALLNLAGQGGTA